MTVRHVRAHPYNCTTFEEAAADLDARVRYHALERQAERRVQTHGLVDAGIKVWQLAYFIPLWEGARNHMVLLGGEELSVEAIKGGRVSEEIVPDTTQNNTGGVGAGDYVGVGPCC